MAAKKKSSDGDREKSSDGDRGINKSGKVVGFTPVKAKPTEAFTSPGQAAKGLSKPTSNDRFTVPQGKTRVINDITGMTLRGSGTPLGTSLGINPLNKSQVTNAALTILGTKGSGQVTKKAAEKVGGFVSGHAFEGGAAKLAGATGKGGKIKNVMTPFGETLGSTKIGSAAEQSSRIENLYSAVAKDAKRAGQSAAKETKAILNTIGQGTRVAAASIVANNTKKKLPKKK